MPRLRWVNIDHGRRSKSSIAICVLQEVKNPCYGQGCDQEGRAEVYDRNMYYGTGEEEGVKTT